MVVCLFLSTLSEAYSNSREDKRSNVAEWTNDQRRGGNQPYFYVSFTKDPKHYQRPKASRSIFMLWGFQKREEGQEDIFFFENVRGRILLSEYYEVLALAALVPVIFFVKFLQQTEKNEEIDVFFVFLKKSGETCRRKLPVQLKMTFSNPIKRHFIESQRNTYQLKRLVSCRPIKSKNQ